ncbi:MAG: hypothetical protein AB8G05_04985 [Oligoflexales bacterium]
MSPKTLKPIGIIFSMLSFLVIEAKEIRAGYFNPISDDKQEKQVILTLGVIWEGQDLFPHNLKALRQIKEDLPWIPMIQFLNPAYFTKPDTNSSQTLDKIKNTISSKDIIGLHLHPWRGFIQYAGIIFRKQPTFWGNQLSDQSYSQEWGHEVPLSIYTEDEITRMIKRSQYLFSKNGLREPDVFMAGGWMAAPHVLEAVRKCGILYDASAIPIEIMKNRLKHFPLFNWLKNIWGSMDPPYQPFYSQTEKGSLGQIVLNGGIPDYNSSKEIVERFSRILETEHSGRANSFHFHLAIYQETAWSTLRSLMSTVNQLKKYASANNVQFIDFHKLEDLFPRKRKVFKVKLSSKN